MVSVSLGALPHQPQLPSPRGNIQEAPPQRELGLSEIQDRIKQSFSAHGQQDFHQAMAEDPKSKQLRHLDGDRAIVVAAGGTKPGGPAEGRIWEAFDTYQGNARDLNPTSSVMEEIRRLNMNAAPGHNRKYIVIGPPANGKTTYAANLADRPDTRFAASVGLLRMDDPVDRAITMANVGEYQRVKPIIAFVFNPNPNEVGERQRSRAASEQRDVPAQQMAEDWLGGPKKVLEGLERNRGNCDFILVNGSTGAEYFGDVAHAQLENIVQQLETCGATHDDIAYSFRPE